MKNNIIYDWIVWLTEHLPQVMLHILKGILSSLLDLAHNIVDEN